MMLSVETWWIALSGPEQIYWGIAIISTGLFIIQLMLTFIGLDQDLDISTDMDALDGGFSIISLRGIIAFFVFSGWGGVAALAQGFSPGKTLIIAFFIGFLAMLAVAYVFAQILKLQESGTVNTTRALLKEGDVYVPIPPKHEGVGRIQLSLAGKTMEFDAITESELLVTGTKVKVIDVLEDNVMLVEPI